MADSDARLLLARQAFLHTFADFMTAGTMGDYASEKVRAIFTATRADHIRGLLDSTRAKRFDHWTALLRERA